MLKNSYEMLRLDIPNRIDLINKHHPDRVGAITEHTDEETLTGKSAASLDSMLRIGHVSVPLLKFRPLWRVGSRATAAFTETKLHGVTRRIWLPGVYYAKDYVPPIAVTHSGPLAEAWDELAQTIDRPNRSSENVREREALIREARCIAEDINNRTLLSTPRAFMLISTRVAADEQPPSN